MFHGSEQTNLLDWLVSAGWEADELELSWNNSGHVLNIIADLLLLKLLLRDLSR